jgi:hypothetical protein
MSKMRTSEKTLTITKIEVFFFLILKRTRLLLIPLCCLLSVQTGMAQPDAVDFNTYVKENNLNGTWFFEKLEFISYRYGDTSVPVEITTIERPDDLNAVTFPFETIFRQMEISGETVICTLSAYGDNPFYMEGNSLSLIKQVEEPDEGELPSLLSIPPCSYAVRGDKLVFSFAFPFGNTRYDFPLEAKISITLNR